MSADAGRGAPARIRSEQILAKGWATFKRVVFELRRRDGGWRTLTREIQDHGNAVAVLPVDADRGTVLLVRQFRLAAFLAGHDGMLIEACAGIIEEGESAEAAVRREAAEELGCHLHDLVAVFDLFTSPGSLTERMVLFTARYAPADRIAAGGGAQHEGEEIEVVEMSIDEATAKIASGEIVDAKTVILVQHLQLTRGAG
jgi:nudix-type nucleoside diphosphatase (YffH/AdpP family)